MLAPSISSRAFPAIFSGIDSVLLRVRTQVLLSPTRVSLLLLITVGLVSPLAHGVVVTRRPRDGQGQARSEPLPEARHAAPALLPRPADGAARRTCSSRARAAARCGSTRRTRSTAWAPGPAELRGRRASRWTMHARQVIYRRDGTKRWLDTGARLGFKAIPGQYRYWKYIHAARVRAVAARQGRPCEKRVEVGPKQSYCLRDLQHRNPQLPRSPASFHYPGCSQDLGQPARDARHLGRLVGRLPLDLPRVYMNVTGLHGCFAYVHVADPKNGIYESNEDNNEGGDDRPPAVAGPGPPRLSEREPGPGGPDGGAEAPR